MRLLPLALLIALVVTFGGPTPTSFAGAATFNVNSEADAPDDDLTDGVCETEENECTLRAGVMQLNDIGGGGTINLPAGTYTLTLPSDFEGDPDATGDLFVDTPLTVAGAGRDATIIDGNDANVSSMLRRVLS